MRSMTFALLVFGTCLANLCAAAPDEPQMSIPPAYAPFEHLAGGWKGTAIPAANRLKGWPERHLWAWKFQAGQPSGLALVIEGGKILAKARLSFDAASKQYTLEGTGADGKPIVFRGPIDAKGQTLTLDRAAAGSDAKERLTIRLNSNRIRYTMRLDRQEPGALQFSRVIDVNVGKEGEQFAAGASAANVAKCIITGGAATLSVSYEGKTYPLCCTGCRDEFLENPVKYVKLAALRAQQDGDRSKAPAASTAAPDDGAFDGLVDEPKKSAGKPASKPAPKPKAAASEKPAAAEKPAASEKPAESKDSAASAEQAARAASLLRSAQSLEKLGKKSAALDYYRQIVKKYPSTPQAKTAAARIKALAP